MLLHHDDCHGDDGADGGKEEVTMPSHCDARLEKNMLPILDFCCPNNRMMRKTRSFADIRHTLPLVALVVRAYKLPVAAVVGLC